MVQRAERVYRAPGAALPRQFWEVDEYNACGGVEMGFLSATTSKAVAMQYAMRSRAGIVFEIQQGLVDRGADLSWLSQYPHEKEVTFPALTGLQVETTRVDGAVLVVELRPCVSSAISAPSALPMSKKAWTLVHKTGQKVAGGVAAAGVTAVQTTVAVAADVATKVVDGVVSTVAEGTRLTRQAFSKHIIHSKVRHAAAVTIESGARGMMTRGSLRRMRSR